MLITAGHSEAWDYTYDFFKIAIEAVFDVEKRQMKSAALAVVTGLELSFSKDKKAVEKFIKEE